MRVVNWEKKYVRVTIISEEEGTDLNQVFETGDQKLNQKKVELRLQEKKLLSKSASLDGLSQLQIIIF